MEKVYIKPAARVYQIHPAAILAGSGTTEQVEVGGGGKHRAREFTESEWE